MRHCSSLSLAPLLLALLMLVMLAGCGQKGPLYLPGNEEAAATYDPGNAYPGEQGDEQADDNGDKSDDSRNGNNADDAEATTSGGEG